MRTLSFSIILHWLLALVSIFSVIYYIENEYIKYPIVAWILLTLIFNKISYYRVNHQTLELIDAYFLFITKSKKNLQLESIERITTVDCSDTFENNCGKHVDFEGSSLVRIISGNLFYKADQKLEIILKTGVKINFYTNTRNKPLFQII